MSRWIDADEALEYLHLMYDKQNDMTEPYNCAVMSMIHHICNAPSIDIVGCEDAISREDALLSVENDAINWCERNLLKEKADGLTRYLKDGIYEQPSVQPQPYEDVISREQTINFLDHGLWEKEWDKALAEAIVRDVPSVQPSRPSRKERAMAEIKPCPICGRRPQIKRDYGYESSGFGAWCSIQCKPLLRRPHLKVEEGKATWERALERAALRWNDEASRKETSDENA